MTHPETIKRIRKSADELIANADLAKQERRDKKDLKKYVLLSTPRTGSSALCNHLKAAGLGAPSEWINPIHIDAVKRSLGVDKINFSNYWELILLGTSNFKNRIFGINCHIDQYLNLRKTGVDFFRIPFDQIYYLERNDKIAQAYSYQKSLQTGTWSKAAAIEAGVQGRFSVTATQLCESLLKIVSEHEFAMKHLDISEENHFIFEDAIRSGHQNYVARIAADLGLKQHEESTPQKFEGKQSDGTDATNIKDLKRILGCI